MGYRYAWNVIQFDNVVADDLHILVQGALQRVDRHRADVNVHECVPEAMATHDQTRSLENAAGHTSIVLAGYAGEGGCGVEPLASASSCWQIMMLVANRRERAYRTRVRGITNTDTWHSQLTGRVVAIKKSTSVS